MTDPMISGIGSEPRKKEWVRIVVIFGALLALIMIPLLRWQHHEARRPSLVEIRVVAATGSDPVFREGPRTVGPEEQVSLAVALRLDYPGIGSQWLAPVESLEIDGISIEHIQADVWPEPDRKARTFWFTLEGPYLGGILSREDVKDKLATRPFLAPELGQEFLAMGEPESHADDDVNLGESLIPVRSGTYRVYARVEVVDPTGSSRPLFTATSLGSTEISNQSLVRISRDLESTFSGINKAAGHLFRLPGFEPATPSDWNLVEACDQLIATSSQSFASVALSGKCSIDDLDLVSIGQMSMTDSNVTSKMLWQRDVRPGDILIQGNHWMVILSDDGNEVLDSPDLVAHSWRRPPAIMPLGLALDEAPQQVTAYRGTVR